MMTLMFGFRPQMALLYCCQQFNECLVTINIAWQHYATKQVFKIALYLDLTSVKQKDDALP